MRSVFDTNILIDYLDGIEAASDELSQYRQPMISVITYIEVLVGAANTEEEKVIQGFLSSFEVVELSGEIPRETISLRKDLRLKLPDAIIYATARTAGCQLVTRNTKDFKSEWPDVRVPYQI